GSRVVRAAYQAAQKSYERAVARSASADAPWTGKSIDIAGRAVAAAGNAVQTARLIAESREKLGSELTEQLLEVACYRGSRSPNSGRVPERSSAQRATKLSRKADLDRD